MFNFYSESRFIYQKETFIRTISVDLSKLGLQARADTIKLVIL
jgi:hypothetical protein